jgi:hypothetical protein
MLQRRLVALEATSETEDMVCVSCRRDGVKGMCQHLATYLSLVPRIEFASDADFKHSREVLQRALECPRRG